MEDYDHDSRQPDRRRWHIKKEISLGDLLALLSAAVAIVYAYNTLDKRVTLLEGNVKTQATVDERQDTEAIRYQARIDKSLDDINRKLDYLMERRK